MIVSEDVVSLTVLHRKQMTLSEIMDIQIRNPGCCQFTPLSRIELFNNPLRGQGSVLTINNNFVGKGTMSNSQLLIESIKQRRESFNSKKRYELHDRVKQLRAEIVKNSFQEQPDMKLHQFLMSQLSKARRQLSFNDRLKKELA